MLVTQKLTPPAQYFFQPTLLAKMILHSISMPVCLPGNPNYTKSSPRKKAVKMQSHSWRTDYYQWASYIVIHKPGHPAVKHSLVVTWEIVPLEVNSLTGRLKHCQKQHMKRQWNWLVAMWYQQSSLRKVGVLQMTETHSVTLEAWKRPSSSLRRAEKAQGINTATSKTIEEAETDLLHQVQVPGLENRALTHEIRTCG